MLCGLIEAMPPPRVQDEHFYEMQKVVSIVPCIVPALRLVIENNRTDRLAVCFVVRGVQLDRELFPRSVKPNDLSLF